MNTAVKVQSNTRVFQFTKPENDAQKAVQKFLSGETASKVGKYVIQGDTLYYQTVVSDSYRRPYHADNNEKQLEHARKVKKIKEAVKAGIIALESPKTIEEINLETWNIEFKKLDRNVIAQRLASGDYVGNSSVLPLVGRRMAWGNEVLNRNETDVQRYVAQFVPMVPFNVFQETGLDLNTMEILERGPEETVKRKRVRWDGDKEKTIIENVHFTGSSLFKVGGKHFLFDIDRREIEHAIFNPFLVELPKPVESIKKAYDSLMPVEVKKAILKGLKVLRQGEWFFIPAKVTKLQLKKNKVFGLNTDSKKSHWQRETLRLQAGERNRPNYAQTGFIERKQAYVTGVVQHSGREHADLKLVGWYRAVPNTAFDKSFTIQGDVD
jgi:hypothetical protein